MASDELTPTRKTRYCASPMALTLKTTSKKQTCLACSRSRSLNSAACPSV